MLQMQQLPRDALDEAVPVVDDEARLLVDARLAVAERLRGAALSTRGHVPELVGLSKRVGVGTDLRPSFPPPCGLRIADFRK